jgi:hypothetical protein
MNPSSPHWSQTSARLLNACPRAWVQTYPPQYNEPLQGKSIRKGAIQRSPKTLDEAMVQSMRLTWLERLEDLFLGKTWSPMYRQRRVQTHADHALTEGRLLAPPPRITVALHRSFNQVHLLEHTLSMKPLFEGRPRRWAYFDRREPASVEGITLYTAPDVAVLHQNKWTLIRIQFRSPLEPSLGQELEHLLMVHWAMNLPGFPKEWTAYRVKVIRWTQQRWVEHHVLVNPKHLQQAMGLVLHDVQEMKWLHRCAAADPSFTFIPLASTELACTGCPFKSECPANDGLNQAKRKQEELIRHHAQSAETKSAKTA